jgi:hypothetical protein
VHDRDPAKIRRREEAGRVAERAAADGHDRLAARDVVPRELTGGCLDDRQPLGRLAFREQHGDDGPPARLEPGRDPGPDGVPRSGLGDDERAPRLQTPERCIDRRRGDPVTDDDPPDRRRCREQPRTRFGRALPLGEMALDRGHDRRDVGDARDVDVGGGVEPFPFRGELPERADRVTAGDERPYVRRSAKSLREHLGSPVQPHDDPPTVKRPAVTRIDDRSAARRDHALDGRAGIGRAEGRDRIAFDPSECGLAVLGEDRRDRPSIGPFDALVEVDEGRGMSAGKPLPDDALAAPRQPDQDDVHRPGLVVAAGTGLVRAGQSVVCRDRSIGRPVALTRAAGYRRGERLGDPRLVGREVGSSVGDRVAADLLEDEAREREHDHRLGDDAGSRNDADVGPFVMRLLDGLAGDQVGRRERSRQRGDRLDRAADDERLAVGHPPR